MSADLLQMRSLGAEVAQEPRRRQQQKLDGLATQLQSVVQYDFYSFFFEILFEILTPSWGLGEAWEQHRLP